MRPGELFQQSAVRTVLLGLVLPLTVLLSMCGVGLPLWSLVTLALIRGHFKAAGIHARSPAMLAGFLLAGLLGALAMAVGLGASIAEHASHEDAWTGIGAVVGPAVLLALLSPLTLIIPALLDPRCRTATHALRAALDGWSRVPARRRVLLWLLPWCALLPGPFLMVAHAQPSTWFWVAGIPVAVVGPLTSLFLVSSWVAVRDAAEDVEDAGHIPRGTVVLASVTALVTLAVGGALAAALMTPVPMSRHEFHPARTIDPRGAWEWKTTPERIEGTSLEVRLEGDGVIIEADDGGGVGRVEPPYGGGQSFRVRSLERGYRVVLRDYGTYWYVDIDREGVRTDDGLGARFAHHIGLFGLSLILLLALGWLASVVAGVKLARAQTLSGIKASTDHRSADRRRVLEGTLRLAEGSSVRVRGGVLVVTGSASIEGAGLRVRIPDRQVRVRGVGELRQGSPIALVGTFERLTSEGHRDASAPWPEHAFVVPGGRERAVAEEIRRASSLAVAAIAPTLVIGLGFLLYLGLESL